jgi:hypothetical protein
MEAIDQRRSLEVVMAGPVHHPRLFSQRAVKEDVDARVT